MNLTQLRAFHAVAQEGSFTKAADFLSVSQPVMTAHVSALEDQYGVPLFHRHGRSITLTGAGEGLLTIACDLFSNEEKADDFLSSHKDLETGLLRISVGNPYSLAPIITEFHEKYPRVTIEVLPGNAENVRDLLMAEHADIAIQTEPDDTDQVCRIPVGRHSLIAFVSAKHEVLSKTKTIDIEELANFPLVLREKGSYTRKVFEKACKDRDLQITPSVTAANRESVFELVASGLGVGLVFSGEIPKDPRIKTLTITGIDVQITDYLFYLKRKQDLKMVKAFLAVAKDYTL